MSDLKISPLFGQVFGDEATVTVIRRLVAAKEATAIDEFPGDALFDFPLRDELQKPASIGKAVATVFAAFIEGVIRNCFLRLFG